jgi:hypothetical protein
VMEKYCVVFGLNILMSFSWFKDNSCSAFAKAEYKKPNYKF